MSGLFCCFYSIFDKILLANTVDPDQTPHIVASDLGQHCLPIIFYGFPHYNGLSEQRAVLLSNFRTKMSCTKVLIKWSNAVILNVV